MCENPTAAAEQLSAPALSAIRLASTIVVSGTPPPIRRPLGQTGGRAPDFGPTRGARMVEVDVGFSLDIGVPRKRPSSKTYHRFSDYLSIAFRNLPANARRTRATNLHPARRAASARSDLSFLRSFARVDLAVCLTESAALEHARFGWTTSLLQGSPLASPLPGRRRRLELRRRARSRRSTARGRSRHELARIYWIAAPPLAHLASGWPQCGVPATCFGAGTIRCGAPEKRRRQPDYRGVPSLHGSTGTVVISRARGNVGSRLARRYESSVCA